MSKEDLSETRLNLPWTHTERNTFLVPIRPIYIVLKESQARYGTWYTAYVAGHDSLEHGGAMMLMGDGYSRYEAIDALHADIDFTWRFYVLESIDDKLTPGGLRVKKMMLELFREVDAPNG